MTTAAESSAVGGDALQFAPPHSFAGLMLRARGPLIWAVAAAVLSAVLSVAPFWFLYRIVVELFSGQPDAARIWQLAAWMWGLLLLRWSLMAISHVLAHQGAFDVQRQLRLAMARHLGEVPLSFFSGRGSGSLRRILTDDVSALEGFFAHMLPDAAASAVVPLAALGLLFIADWRLALAAIAPLPVAFAAQTLLMRYAAARMNEWGSLQKRLADQLGEYVRGVHVVKSFGLAARSFGELAEVVRGAAVWVADYSRASSAGWVLFMGLLSANVVIVAPLGAWLHVRGSLDLPTYALFLLVSPAVLLPLLRLTFALGEQAQRAEGLDRINAVLSSPSLTESPEARVIAGPLAIEFVDVRHRYGARRALDGVSFAAEPGQITALVGASGSGKSTVARLLPRLYEYESGSVRVGGIDVRQWRLDALLERIGIVFQEVFLFDGTVAENLRFARPGASDAQLEAAARAARAHAFIRALPRGYDTPLGERGARLSGGERQRLSIARALLKDAPILLLDEATASVDAESEALIQQALSALCRDRTVLMIAHRLRTVMNADRIVVLEQGRVAAQGHHGDLLRECAIYRQLWHDHEVARDWSLGAAGLHRSDDGHRVRR